MSSPTLKGFLKAALLPELIGGGFGGLLGAVIARSGNRFPSAAIGASLGAGLGTGVSGLLDEPDFSGLTRGEIEAMQEEAADAEKMRNLMRLAVAGGGIATAIATRSPLPMVAAIPAATIEPIGHEAAHLRRMAKSYRAARRSS